MAKEYTIGVTNYNGLETEYIRIKSEDPVDVELGLGFHDFEAQYSDSIVHDHFRITAVIKEEHNIDGYYAWYLIDNHTNYIESTISKQIAENSKAIVDYNIMMGNLLDPQEDAE